jgi:DNA-binding HxlR family transcriptional regulator
VAGPRVSEECEAVHRVLNLLGRAWAGPVLWALLGGARRYTEVRELVPGVSDAVLAARLKDLCDHGLAERTVDPGPPVTVRYAPTATGRDARRVLRSLRDFAGRHPDLGR